MIPQYLKLILFLVWLTRRDLIDMWLKLILIKRPKYFLISNLLLLSQFKHVTNNSSEPIFDSELEDELFSSEIYILWK